MKYHLIIHSSILLAFIFIYEKVFSDTIFWVRLLRSPSLFAHKIFIPFYSYCCTRHQMLLAAHPFIVHFANMTTMLISMNFYFTMSLVRDYNEMTAKIFNFLFWGRLIQMQIHSVDEVVAHKQE